MISALEVLRLEPDRDIGMPRVRPLVIGAPAGRQYLVALGLHGFFPACFPDPKQLLHVVLGDLEDEPRAPLVGADLEIAGIAAEAVEEIQGRVKAVAQAGHGAILQMPRPYRTAAIPGKRTVMATDDELTAAFHAHKEGQPKFTRRMAINIADFFELKPMHVVWRLEKLGLVRRGSWAWFKKNGGITQANIEEARADRLLGKGAA